MTIISLRFGNLFAFQSIYAVAANLWTIRQMPVERRLPVGGRHVRPQEEWNGEKFALNFGNRISFIHTPVQMRRNDKDVLVGKLFI